MAVGHFLALTVVSGLWGARTFYKSRSLPLGVTAGVVFGVSFCATQWVLGEY